MISRYNFSNLMSKSQNICEIIILKYNLKNILTPLCLYWLDAIYLWLFSPTAKVSKSHNGYKYFLKEHFYFPSLHQYIYNTQDIFLCKCRFINNSSFIEFRTHLHICVHGKSSLFYEFHTTYTESAKGCMICFKA